MRITSFAWTRERGLPLCVGTALGVVCVGIGAWVAGRSKPPEVEKAALAAQPQKPSKHFTGKCISTCWPSCWQTTAAASGGRLAADWPAPRTRSGSRRSAIRFHHDAPDFTLLDHRSQPWSLQAPQSGADRVGVLPWLCVQRLRPRPVRIERRS